LADEFSFTLTETTADITGDPYTETVTNAADGTFTFSELAFYAAGTYTYTVAEDSGSLSSVTYDTTEYTVTVVVTDDGQGNLTAAKSITDSADLTFADTNIVFANTYTSKPGGGGGGTTTTPTPTPATPTPTPETPEPSTAPTPTPSVTPGDGTGTTTPPTINPELPAPPEPANPGSTLVPNETGTGYIEIGADGTPLGAWTVGDDGVWIFDEYVPLVAYVAVTGESASVTPQTGDPVPLTLLVVVLCLSGGALLLLLFTGRKKKE